MERISSLARLPALAQVMVLGLRDLHAGLNQRTATVALGAVALLSALLYWWGFVQPFALLDHYERPLLHLHNFVKVKPSTHWLLVSAFLGQGALYWLGWRAAQRASGRLAWGVVLGAAALFAGLLLWMYPFGAADLFDNVLHGRVLGVYGGNPFTQPPAAFPDDPLLAYVAWPKSTSAYGPGWEALAGLTAWLVGDGILANVFAFKLLAGSFLVASVAIVAVILRRTAPERALAGVLLLAWNPVILYETFGNGHNDMSLVVWILAAAWALVHRRYTLAILALVVGALFKFIPLLMLPAAGLIALRDQSGWRQRLRFLLLTGSAAVVLVVAAYWPFWADAGVLSIERRARLYTTSLPAVAVAAVSPVVDAGEAAQGVAVAAALITAVWALWQGVLAWRDRSWLSFPRAAFKVLIFYLLFTCLWFQQWYAVWPLGVAALLPPGHAARLAALFGYTALAKQLVFEPLWLWVRPLPPKSWRELRLGPAVMLIPWLYVLCWAWLVRRRSQPADTQSATGDTVVMSDE